MFDLFVIFYGLAQIIDLINVKTRFYFFMEINTISRPIRPIICAKSPEHQKNDK